jgi:Ca2+-binding EF-hand superfamily protein
VRAFLVLLLLGVASARADNEAMAFRALDLDGDGYISLAEAAGNEEVVTRFDRADKNRDGKLSPREFANLKNIKVRVAKKKPKEPVRTAAGAKSKEGSAAAGGTRPSAP